MDNAAVSRLLLRMARAMEYLDENPFKASAYRRAAQTIVLLGEDAEALARDGSLSEVPGIGKAISEKIRAWAVEHDLSAVKKVEDQLPEGFDELLKVPGLGLKRIRALHRERGIGTPEDLLKALEEGRLAGLRAFPRKFLEGLPQAVERVMSYRGKCTLDMGLALASVIQARLAAAGISSEPVGQCRRGGDVIEAVELLVHGDAGVLEQIASSGVIAEAVGEIASSLGAGGGRGEPALSPGASQASGEGPALVIHSGPLMPPVLLKAAPLECRIPALLVSTGSAEHVRLLRERACAMGVEITDKGVFREGRAVDTAGEEDIYALLGLQHLPPETREGRPSELARAAAFAVPGLITMEDVRGTIHIHSTYSDGVNPLPDMVNAARARGYEWIGISDHSRSASYAGGLDIAAVERQHREIDELNRTLEGITILKGIESDILNDGSLDYPDEILGLFDFVVASIHSGMDMDRGAMTKRIVKALKNPRTGILAHPTGRLLLAREPYAVDMEAVLEAALEMSTAVEVNSHPIRLDLDWRLIESFIARGGVVALSPDAHTTEGLDDMRYGVVMGRKGFLTPASCLNAWDDRTARRFLKKT